MCKSRFPKTLFLIGVFLNLCKARHCLGVTVYWLYSVLFLVSQAWHGTLKL